MPPHDSYPAAAMAAVLGDVGHLMGTVAHALGSRETLALDDLGLSLRTYGVLSVAARATLSQADLAGVTGIDRATLVGLLDELEALGLVRRDASPSDRRTRLVVLTGPGHELATRATRVVQDVENAALGDLTEEERRALLDILRTLGTGRLAKAVDLSHVVTTRRRRPSTGRLS